MGGKSGAPSAPNFNRLAMVNQANPMGGVSWSGGGGSQSPFSGAFGNSPLAGMLNGSGGQGPLSMTSGFSGQNQDTFNSLMGGMNQAASFNPAMAGQQAQDKVYGAYQSRLDPMWAAKEGAFAQSMANQGLDPGSEAYGNAARVFGEQRNDAYNQAIGQSVALGQGEQAQARANANQPFQQAAGMLSMLPRGNPNAPFEAGAAQYQAAMDGYSADQAKKGSALSGLGNIGGMALGGYLGGLGGGKK